MLIEICYYRMVLVSFWLWLDQVTMVGFVIKKELHQNRDCIVFSQAQKYPPLTFLFDFT